MTLFEVDEAANRIKEEVDPDANIIVGSTLDESIDGEMRVSVVATGIESREARSEPVAAANPVIKAETKPTPPPSFRLRPQMPKLTASSLFPLKPAAAIGEARDQPASAAPGDAEGLSPADREPQEVAPAEPQPAEAAASGPARSFERGFPHPPLPPQERFQEWGRLRAPVRELERPPSLFERVTASFGRPRPERPGELAPGGPRVGGVEPHLAVAEEEESYDIPAFLRR
jgi:cell division protein FtsZ